MIDILKATALVMAGSMIVAIVIGGVKDIRKLRRELKEQRDAAIKWRLRKR